MRISAVDAADSGNARAVLVLEADHGVEAAVGVVGAVALNITPALACHPEVLVPVRAVLGGVVLSPVLEGGHALGLEGFPGSLLNVLRGVAAEAVYAVGLDPLSQPAGDVARYGVGAAVLALLGAEGAFSLPLGLQELRNRNALCLLGAEVGETGEASLLVAARAFVVAGETGTDPVVAPPSAPGGRVVRVVNGVMQRVDACELVEVGLCSGLVLEGAEVEFKHVLDGVVARVVHNDIHDDADAVRVSGVNHRLELLLCTEVGVGLGVVEHVVAVVGVVSEVVRLTGGYVAVDLLVGSGQPDGVDAEVVEVALVDLLGDTCEVAAVEGTRSGLPSAEGVAVRVGRSAVGVVV